MPIECAECFKVLSKADNCLVTANHEYLCPHCASAKQVQEYLGLQDTEDIPYGDGYGISGD